MLRRPAEGIVPTLSRGQAVELSDCAATQSALWCAMTAGTVATCAASSRLGSWELRS